MIVAGGSSQRGLIIKAWLFSVELTLELWRVKWLDTDPAIAPFPD
jgi:hypothetical protein